MHDRSTPFIMYSICQNNDAILCFPWHFVIITINETLINYQMKRMPKTWCHHLQIFFEFNFLILLIITRYRECHLILPPINLLRMSYSWISQARINSFFKFRKFCLFFSSPKLMYMKNKQYKRVFGSHFLLERNKYCSTFMMIEYWIFTHSINEIFIFLQANMYWCPVLNFEFTGWVTHC